VIVATVCVALLLGMLVWAAAFVRHWERKVEKLAAAQEAERQAAEARKIREEVATAMEPEEEKQKDAKLVSGLAAESKEAPEDIV